jgi:hypothetical protein
MKNPKSNNTEHEVDILILHGLSHNIVNYLEGLFNSLGIYSATVIELPSLRKGQGKKVDYYIKNCKIPLVLATYDEETKDHTRARPNIYDEITRCQKMRGKDTIILQEKSVQLASNTIRDVRCIFPFERNKIHLMLPKLLTELKSRNLLFARGTGKKTMEVGKTLNDFLDGMDNLWDNEFDEAWEKIPRPYFDAERNFGETLDKFFQLYQNVFSALIRGKKVNDDLKQVCDKNLEEAWRLASTAWGYVADANMKKADEARENIKKTRKSFRHEKMYSEASSEIWRGKGSETNTDKIKHLRKAIELTEKYISKLAD